MKILFFFPLNPLEKNEGNKVRALKLLQYFNTRNFDVDFVTEWDDGMPWNESDIKFITQSGLANNLFFIRRKPKKKNIIKYLIKYKLANAYFQYVLKIPEGSIPNNTSINHSTEFNDILEKNIYDKIIISYAYWSYLIKNKNHLKNASTIIDTHDFLSSQHQHEKNFQLGNALEEEFRRLQMFDQVWAISTDELYLFSQFLGNKIKYVPMMVEKGNCSTESKIIDLIYVASQNQHNQASAKWFFEEVYPLLDESITILVIGKITQYIGEYHGITKILFADNLDEHYCSAKVAICPMLSGTGIKVKVVEALSFGLPVVCTTRGIDGLPNKNNNGCLVTDKADTFAEYISQLLNDKYLYKKHSSDASDLFNTYFEQERCFKNLDEFLNQ